MNSARRLPEGWTRVLLPIASVALTLAAVELSSRLVWSGAAKPVVSKIGRQRVLDPIPGIRYLYPARASYRQTWPDDPRGYFDPPDRSLEYRLNNFGFRDEDFAVARGARLRLAFLGDSFCFGLGVRSEHLATTLIEDWLNRQAPLGQQYEVYSFCMPGFNSRDEAALAEHVVRHFQPDLIVVWYFLNDVNVPPELYVGHSRPPARFETARSYSRWLDLVLSRFERRWLWRRFIEDTNAAYADGHPGRAAVAESLARLAAVGGELEAPVVLVVQPSLSHLRRGRPDRYPFRHAHEAVASLAAAQGWTVIDLVGALSAFRPSSLWVHPSDHHPNELAHEAMARVVFDSLAALIRGRGDEILAGAARRRRTPVPPDLVEPAAREWFRAFADHRVRTSSRGIEPRGT